MSGHDEPRPVNGRLLTRGIWGLLILTGFGICFGAYRFAFGLAASTNLDQQYPWGLWIIADVSFIALAAGGFTMAAVVHVFHREHFHSLARPVLVAAMLGYSFAVVALLADLGRYYNIWRPILPSCWQGNSALFEVGMCVMCYMTVLYIEFVPVFCERFIGDLRFPQLSRICRAVNQTADKVMFVFIVIGVGISFLHQSSLGHIMVLVPSKLHPLWYSPILSLLFLMSAIAVGFPTAIFVSVYSSWAMKLKPDMTMLSSLAKYVPFFGSIYLALKIGDMLIRGSYVHLTEATIQTFMFVVEMLLWIVPLVLILARRVRHSPRWLGLTTLALMLSVVVNRANVYWIGYQPPRTNKMYFPSLAEWGVTIGAIAALILIWRIIATVFPIISRPQRVRTA